LTQKEANDLHAKYYTQYGLAIEGLVRHHNVDALDFNAKVDDALPLENILRPDPKLRQLLEDINRDKVKPWLLTNAYINHGRRVVKLLEVEDLFEGITYCDYGAKEEFLAKPRKEFYLKAMREASVGPGQNCYFVGKLTLNLRQKICIGLTSILDDSYQNCKGAHALGWIVAHLVEPSVPLPALSACEYTIRSLEELRDIFPQCFKSRQVNGSITT
jgi:pyrimidine and pyridine-specific 5'-nucleotidase